MSYQVLARKWRPKTFAEVVGQEHIIRALTNALTQKRLHHAYLFSGTRGVGKTTIARILVKCLNCETGITATPCGKCDTCSEIDSGRMMDLIEVDAASRTKVEDTRDLLENLQYLPAKSRYKIYLIDEVHMLSGHSFNALLKTLEEPPEHVKFLLATTDPQKLPVTVLSRCLQFNLKIINQELMQKQLQQILTQEKIAYEELAVHQLAVNAHGSVRDALSLLDQAIAFGNNQINTAEVNTMLGTIDTRQVLSLLEALAANDAKMMMGIIAKSAELAMDFVKTIDELLELLHQITIVQLIPDASNDNWQYPKIIQQLATKISPEETQLYYQIGLIGKRDLSLAPSLQSGFEMLMLRMLAFRPEAVPSAIIPPPKTTMPKPTNASNPTTDMPLNNQEQNLLQKLDLTGPTKALLQHCTITKIDTHTIEIMVDPSQASLLNKKQEERINIALSKHYNDQITVKIKLGTPHMTTPANTKKLEDLEEQTLATQLIEKDHKIKELMDKFDAKVIDSSIKK